MNQHFIINQRGENSLSSVINGILPTKTKAFDVLVGYFYFSGLAEIYNNINDIHVRILVGLEMEKELLNKTSEINKWNKKTRTSKMALKRDYYDSLVNLCNTTDYFDSEEHKKAFSLYYQKIVDGSLEIRKTKEPCHAKMYIFSLKDELNEGGTQLGTLITGSSNLTHRGLTGQNEINVRFDSTPEVKEGLSIFNKLWDKSIIIADKDNIIEFNENVIQKIWIDRVVSPKLIYLRVLHEFFTIDTSRRIRTPHDITNGRFFNLKYQEDAVRMAIQTLEKHNGVIISDVVGLGKSIIASTVANNLNLRTIIIAPPHLTTQWEEYRVEFNFNATVFSSGIIKRALEHYQLICQESEQWLIIVDEAHNFRNEYIQDYALLHELCQNNKVVLLTATPFNNKPEDIFSMLKLFQIPTKSTLKTVKNLNTEFGQLINEYKILRKAQKEKSIDEEEVRNRINVISNKIRTIIQPLVIRRSRLDLDKIPDYRKDLKRQKIAFPQVNDPILLEYPLGRLTDIYSLTLNRISPRDTDNSSEDIPRTSFKATRYKPIKYVKSECVELLKKDIEEAGFEYNLFSESQSNLSDFMRRLLVRRFESSQEAFRISVVNMRINCENIYNWVTLRESVPIFKKGNLPNIENLYNSSNDSLFPEEWMNDELKAYEERGLFEINAAYLNENFLEDLKSDIDILKRIELDWKNITFDPKIEQIITILQEQLKNDPKRKIVVFTEFADTANYLYKKLKSKKIPVFKYSSSDASTSNKEKIRANFDAGYKIDKQKDDYKILIATDAISEGYSLHRAGTIFNFDIPYNPTRVIQRIGRINRINKKVFNNLYIYNYFPTAIGEAETRSREIATLKMAMIQSIMGEDTKVLTNDEQLQSFFNEQYRKIIKENEEESWNTKYESYLQQMRGSTEMKDALKIPLRTKIRRITSKNEKGILVFGKKGNDFIFKLGHTQTMIEAISPEKAFYLLEPESDDEKGFFISNNFYLIYNYMEADLFKQLTEERILQTRKNALARIKVIKEEGACEEDYLEDLIKVIELDSIPGFTLRKINKLKREEFHTLPSFISSDYLTRILNRSDYISHGKELLILSEEIESDVAEEPLIDEQGQILLPI